MMRKIASVVLTCCAACHSSSDPASPVTVTAEQAGSTIELQVSQELRVRLASNPSTGYSWSFTCVPEELVSSLGAPQYTPDSSGLVGSGGVDTFAFRAVRTGQATLRFEYRRPWETEVPATQSIAYSLRVRE
jgi:inhibitor of cysteine peptidase